MSAIDTLLQQIKAAFAVVPRPARVTKRVARALDDEWFLSQARGRELYEADAEAHWTELTDADVEEFRFILPWLDEEGLRFYLPAFMCYCLRRWPDEAHRAVCDTQATCADPARHRPFSLEQLACVRAFRALYPEWC